jgi:DNA (cytosine-5)-methyltransferase 1
VPRPSVAFSRSAPLRLEPDARAPDWESWAAWADKQDRPLAVDLFAGGGGLSLGLEDAGFRVALAVDHDKWSVETHAANFQGLSVQLDLSEPAGEARLIELLHQRDIALVAGGPPCQPFSRAGRSAIRYFVGLGKRAAYDERRDLWQVWLRIVLAVQPQAVMLENVPDMALGDDLGVVRRIVEALQGAGYETHLDIVEAPEYGIPQHRQRLILVALREEVAPFAWPVPTERVSTWEAIGDLPALGESVGAEVLPYRKRSRTLFQERARSSLSPEQLRFVHDHVTRAVRDDDREAFRLMGPNTRYSDLPDHLKRYRDDTFDDKYKRHGRDELARSITAHIAKDGYWYIHPTEERTLSVREAARLQTFPDRYRFAGTRTHAYKQIGNAVPPLLAERIGRQILVALGSALPEAPRPHPVGAKTPPVHFASGVLRDARAMLDDWAEMDALGAPWRHRTDIWPALVSSVLTAGQRADDGTVDIVLWQAPTPGDLTREWLEDSGLPPGNRKALARLLPAAERWRRQQEPSAKEEEPWWSGAALLPAEADRFACLAFGADVLLTTTAPMRVAARVTGRPVDKVDRLTAGRLALAEIVGGGQRAADRMAAVAALGRVVCTAELPDCGACPLAVLCRESHL